MSGNFLLVYQYNEVIFYVPLTLKSYEDKVLHFHQEVVYLEALYLTQIIHESKFVMKNL